MTSLASRTPPPPFSACLLSSRCASRGQDESDQLFPAPGVELAYPGILAIYAVADDRIVLINEGEKPFQITNVELSIGVHKKAEFLACSAKAAYQGCPVALVDFMGDETDPCVSLSNGGYNAPRLVRAAIIDHNDLKVLHPATQRLKNTGDGAGNDLRLVVSWQDDREPTINRGSTPAGIPIHMLLPMLDEYSLVLNR